MLYVYFIWLDKRYLPDYVMITEERICHEARISMCFLPKVSLVSNTHIKYHVKFWVSMNWRLRGTCIQSDELIFFCVY